MRKVKKRTSLSIVRSTLGVDGDEVADLTVSGMDTAKNGIYEWDGTKWVKGDYYVQSEQVGGNWYWVWYENTTPWAMSTPGVATAGDLVSPTVASYTAASAGPTAIPSSAYVVVSAGEGKYNYGQVNDWTNFADTYIFAGWEEGVIGGIELTFGLYRRLRLQPDGTLSITFGDGLGNWQGAIGYLDSGLTNISETWTRNGAADFDDGEGIVGRNWAATFSGGLLFPLVVS